MVPASRQPHPGVCPNRLRKLCPPASGYNPALVRIAIAVISAASRHLSGLAFGQIPGDIRENPYKMTGSGNQHCFLSRVPQLDAHSDTLVC